MNCQWKENDTPPCGAEAPHELKDKNGKVWTHLCDAHRAAYDAAIGKLDAKAILGVWVRASGGSKALAESMSPGIQKGVQAILKLRDGLAKPHKKRQPGESVQDYIRRVVRAGS